MTTELQELKIVCLSDTHNQHSLIQVPAGDILIHAGDFTVQGEMSEVLAFNRWLGRQPHRHKVVIAGNHDRGFERDPDLYRSLLTNAHYLENSGIELEGFRFWGSPVTPWNHNMAFNVQAPEALAQIWAQMPDDIDILITHGPPAGILDTAADGSAMGDQALLERLGELQLDGQAPRLHIFGHIHPAAGHTMVNWDPEQHTLFINACQLDADHRPHQQIPVIKLEPKPAEPSPKSSKIYEKPIGF